MVAALFAEELEHAGRTALLAARAGADLAALGYHMQVTPHAGQAALFILDGERTALQVDGDRFLLGETAVPRQSLIDRARTDPARFSPNVLLRPLVQDTLFPTACYVAGPNELAYLAQLRGVYSAFGLPMPLISPRATATLVDSATLRFLSKHDVSLESMQAQNEQALNELLRRLLPPSVEQSIDDAERELTARMEAVIAALPAVDPTLEGKARSIAGRISHELETLRSKVLQAAKRRDDTLRRQYLHAQSLAFPAGEPQERVVSGVSHLARYGPGLLSRLIDDLPLDTNRHWVVTV
jgi:bacillithiol biosynthesis cysteine-adding enzyme BshC